MMFVLLGTKVVLACQELSLSKSSFLPSLKCSHDPLFGQGLGEPSVLRKVNVYAGVVWILLAVVDLAFATKEHCEVALLNWKPRVNCHLYRAMALASITRCTDLHHGSCIMRNVAAPGLLVQFVWNLVYVDSLVRLEISIICLGGFLAFASQLCFRECSHTFLVRFPLQLNIRNQTLWFKI